jgi:hypothetical protein
MKNSVFYVSMVAASKYIGAGIAVLGVIGAGIGVGIIKICFLRLCFNRSFRIIINYDGIFNLICLEKNLIILNFFQVKWFILIIDLTS